MSKSCPTAPRVFAFVCVALLLCLALTAPSWAGPQQSGPTGPKIWLQEPRSVPVKHVPAAAGGLGDAAQTALNANGIAAQLLATGQAQPLSLINGDFDSDGVEDLAVGYAAGGAGVVAIHRGNLDAFAPQSDASFQAIGRGEFPSPFLPEARVFSVPVQPDFMAVGNFAGQGNEDLVVAAKSGGALYIFLNDGKGNFGAPQVIQLKGAVTTLAAGNLGLGEGFTNLLVGTSGPGSSSSLLILGGTGVGLGVLAALPVSAPASNIAFGEFGDASPDAAFLAGGQVFILRPSVMQVVPVSLPVSASALALGSFLYDRNGGSQIAALTADGSVHIAVRNEFDPRVYTVQEIRAIREAKINHQPAPAFVPPPSFPMNGWKIAESFPGAAPGNGQSPLLFRTRVSINGADDVMVLNAFSGQLTLISHPDVQPGAQTFLPGQVSLRPYSGPAIAALPMRLNVDGRLGVMALHSNEVAPSLMVPIPDPTFFVNKDTDPTPTSPIANACNNTSFTDLSSSCSLREAVLKANGDTIMLQAGHTYSLTIGRGATQDYTGNTGALYVNHTATIVGGNQNTTIVQWGTPGTGTVDMVMAVNEDISIISNASASISNLTIQNGVNHGAQGLDGDGGCMEFDTGANGTATLSLTNVTLQNCSTLQGGGGGLVIFNFVTPAGAGGATISNSIIQNNSVVSSGSAGIGGGIAINFDAHMTMTASQVKNNAAVQNCTPTCGLGAGGGIVAFAPQNVSAATGETFIHSSTISGNKSAGFGGAINTSASISIDQGTVISGNTAGTDGSNPTAHSNQEGGGLYLNPAASCPLASTCAATLSKVTITGNTATGNGGGISYGNGSAGTVGALSMSFSRLAGNTTSGGSGSNLSNNHGNATVTDNWWGTNSPSGTINTISATTTFDPFIVLTHTSSPQTIKVNQSATLTGDMSKDNHGNGAALGGNLGEIVGLPITFDAANLGTIPQAQPETLNANAQATATFNAGGTGGLGTANATVDQAAVPVNSSLIASATESGTTVTITTVGTHGFSTGQFVSISGVGVGGYNGQFFLILSTPTATTFTYTANTSGLGASSGGTATTGIVILQPPSISKSFGGTKIVPTNTPNTLTFSITNPNVVPINASLTDNLPTNVGTVPGSLVVASTPNVVNNCGGSASATAGSGTISFSNSTLPVGTCTIQVNVSSAVDNVYSNSVTIDSTDAGNGNTSSDTLNVINPPHIAKSFGAATIPLNGTTGLTLTVSSTNQNQTLTGIAFTDSLPSGLVVATPASLNSTCTGTSTGTAGSSSVSLSSASLAPGASCTVSVTVQGKTAGVKSNSVTVSDTTAGTGNTSSTSLAVVAPPTISKSFSPKSVPLNGNSTLSFTVTNPNTASALSGVAFTDSLPGGVKLASTTVTGSCGSGTITATINNPPGSPSTVSLSGGTLTASPAAGSSCTFSVSVTGISAGAQVNTAGAVSSTEGGTGGTATDTLTVVAPPTISKSFSPKSVPLNGSSTLSFTVTNPNTASALSGVTFTDSLPAGLKLASTTVTGSCGSGTITATINNPPGSPSTVSLSGGTLTASPAAGSSCTFSAGITGISAGAQVNTTSTVSSTEGGTGGTASDTLTVIAPATISKSFSPKSVALNSNSTLSFTVTNPNTASALSGIAFTDSLPAGVKLNSSTVTGSCGSGTITATINNPPGSPSTVSLSGGTLTASPAAGSSCTFSVSITGISAGAQVNTTGNVSSTEGGTGGTASDTLTVIAPPTISKHFGHTTLSLNQSDILSFTLTNPNTSSVLSGIAFTDTLPGGLKLASTTVTGSCGSGTITATINNPPGSPSTVSLSGGTLTASPAAGSSCTFSVNITGISAGAQVNTTSTVSSTEGGTGGTATDTITVVAPPTITKAFNPTAISVGGTTTMTITITNPSATVGLTGVGFTDNFPANLVVANPNALSNTCNGTPTATAGSGTVSLTGGTIAANSSCLVTVNVTSSVSGTYLNSTGPVGSTEGGTGATSNTASLTVAAPPSITKLFGASTIPLNGTTSLTFNITNPNIGVALSGVALTDSLPAGLVVATPPNVTGSCGSGTITAVAGSGTISLSGGTLTASPAAGSSCTFSANVTGTTGGVKNNNVQVTSTEGGTGNTSSASLTVVAPPTIAKAFNATSIALNGTSTLTFTITNPNTTLAGDLTGVAFSDTLPSGTGTLVVAAIPNVSNTCGGTVTATSGTGVITLSSGTVAHTGSCTLSVNVTGTAAGDAINTTGAITSTQGGTGNTASANLTVVAPPSIAKVFNPTTTALNATTSLQFTITNPAANTVAEAGVAFTDTLPTGLTVASGTSTVCGGTMTTTNPTGISLTGATIATSSQCQFSVTVTGAASGQYTNTTGAVSSTNGGTGNTASANLTVASPPVIVKSFGATTLPANGSTSLNFTLTNPAGNAIALTGVAFTDGLPAGLVVATPNALTNTCGGTATAVTGSGSVSLSGVTLAPNASCTVSANVTAVTGGVKNNSVQVTSTNGGTGNTSNATLTAVAAPLISKAFGATSIPLIGSTSLTFTIQNTNATQSLSGIAFTDSLPTGLVVSTPNGLTGSCGSGSITAAQGAGTVSLAGATLAASASCTFGVNVTATAAGQQNNTTSAVTSTEGGTGTAASASVTVVAPPSIAKAFTPSNISPNGVSALTFTISNPAANTVALTGVSFADTLPGGMTVATPNGLAGSCGAGTITATAGSGSVNLAGATIAAGSSCNFSVNVTSNSPGVLTNTTGAVTSTNGGTGNIATASLTVGAPPSIAKSFGAASIGLAGSTSLSFTITNPNAALALTGIAFTDTLPSGLVVSTPNGLTGTCGTGTVSAVAGSSAVSLTGGTIATSATCTFSINVTAVAAGSQVNTTGAVSATNGGTGNTATASINVLAPDLTIAKSHSGNFFLGQTGATYSVMVSNAGPGPTAGTVTVTEVPPSGLTVTSLAGSGWTCTLGTLTCTRTDALAAAASYPAISVMVNVATTAPASATNVATVAGGGELNLANDTASDLTTITQPPDFSLAFAPTAITLRAGQEANYVLTITPLNNVLASAITLTATGVPPKTQFVFTPSSVTLGANPATSTLTVITTGGDPFLARNSSNGRGLLFAMIAPLAGLLLSGLGFRKRSWRNGKAGWALLALMLLCCGVALNGCASAQNFRNLGTPPGTYTITVTAMSGATQHSTPVTLTVQP